MIAPAARLLACCVIALVFVGQLPVATASPNAEVEAALQHGRDMLLAGDADGAYRVLNPLADVAATNPDYSYVFGVAALDSGHPGEALFAFERVLALRPDDLNARAELARTHVELGELALAERELDTVLAANPPENVRTVVESYRRLVRQERVFRKGIGKVDVSGFVATTAGYDSNINTATDDTTVGIPLLGGFRLRLSRLFVEQGSSLLGASAGADVSYRASRANTFFAGASASGRYHFSETDFAPYTLRGLAGVRHVQGDDVYTLSADTTQHFVGGFHLERFYGGTAQWARNMDQRNRVGAFVRFSDQTFPETRRLDSRLYMAGGVWNHALGGEGQPVVSMAVYLGVESERGNDPTVGRRLVGAQLGYSRTFGDDDRVEATLGWEDSTHGAKDPLFLKTRRDHRLHAAASWEHALTESWAVSPEVAYTLRRSNIDLHDFKRLQAMVTLRYDFD